MMELALHIAGVITAFATVWFGIIEQKYDAATFYLLVTAFLHFADVTT